MRTLRRHPVVVRLREPLRHPAPRQHPVFVLRHAVRAAERRPDSARHYWRRNGLYGLEPVEKSTPFVSRYASSVSIESSRPKPDCLYPPNGMPGNAVYGVLIPTMPDLIARATRCPRAGSPVHTVAN